MRDRYRYTAEARPGTDKRQRRRIRRRDGRAYAQTPVTEYRCHDHGLLWRGYRAEALTGPLSLLDAIEGHRFFVVRP